MKEFFKKLGRKLTGKKGIGNTMTVVIIIAVVMLNVLAYTVTNAFGLYFYSPPKRDFSLSGSTDDLFSSAIEMKKKVTITFCYLEDKLEEHSTGSYVLNTAREFEKRYPELIELKFINLLTKMDEDGAIADLKPYSNVVCQNKPDKKTCGASLPYNTAAKNPVCKSCGAALDLEKDVVYNLRQNSIIFESGTGEEWNCRVLTDRSSSVGFVDFFTLDSNASIVAYNGEEVMASMISWVLQKEHPVAYFTQNHGETADIAFSNLLTSAGYYVEVINLRQQNIPEDAGMLIISNPTSDFDRYTDDADRMGELNKIEAYLERGGKLYVALDPYVKELPNLENTLYKWGISCSGRLNENDVFVRDIVRENSKAITPDGYTFVATHADNEVATAIKNRVTTYGKDSILVSEVARLELDESKGARPLLVSGSTSSTFAGGEETDNKGEYTIAAYSIRQEEGGKTSTVFVIPTAYITSTDAFLSENYSNKDFLYSTLEVLFDSNLGPRGCNQVNYTQGILENLTMGRAKLYTALILTVPVALATVGVITIIRRKNR